MSSTIRLGEADNNGQLTDRLNEIIREEPPTGKPDDVFVSAPTMDALEELSKIEFDADETTRSLTVLFNADLLRPIQRNFLLGSRLEELRDPVTYVATSAENISPLPVISTPDKFLAFVTIAGQTQALSTESERAVGDAYAEYEEFAEGAGEVDFRNPSRSEASSSLAEDFGESLAHDFQRVLEALERSDRDTSEVGAEIVALLVGAKHGVPQYDLGKWAENVDAASKATVSRRKQALEDLGLAETTKIPRDIGRPRYRLHLVNEDEDSPERFAEIAADVADR